MKLIKSISEWQTLRQQLHKTDNSIGFVPTMGALHKGHAKLLELAQAENDISVLSIFVNPTQFNQAQDYENYPNNIGADLALAEKLKIDYVLLPSKAALYPSEHHFMVNTVHPLGQQLEGDARPGHFTGVLTIVLKLLTLVQPKKLYLGEKDYQQYALIKKLVEDFLLPIEVFMVPTQRQASGLPYSSRLARLNKDEIALAEKATAIIRQKPFAEVSEHLTKLGIKVDYLEVLEERVFIAFHIGPIRLIDNFPLTKREAVVC